MPAGNLTFIEEEGLQSQFEEFKEPIKQKKAAKKKANNKKKAKNSNKMNQAVDEDENPEEYNDENASGFQLPTANYEDMEN